MSELDLLIDEQENEIKALLTLLHQESSAIALRNAEEITQISKQKINLVHSLQLRDAKIAKQSPFDSDTHLDTISRIKSEFLTCQKLNDTNGILLRRAQLSMHKLHNIFQEASGKHELTYDSEGQASGSKTLGTNFKA